MGIKINGDPNAGSIKFTGAGGSMKVTSSGDGGGGGPAPVPTLIWTTGAGEVTITDWNQIAPNRLVLNTVLSNLTGGTAYTLLDDSFSTANFTNVGNSLRMTNWSSTQWNPLDYRPDIRTFAGGPPGGRLALLGGPSPYVPGDIVNIDDFTVSITSNTVAVCPSPITMIIEMRSLIGPWIPGEGGGGTGIRVFLMTEATRNSVGL